MRSVTSDDVRRALGPLDVRKTARIVATGATADELIEAFHALDRDDERSDALSPRVQRLRALLDSLWGGDEPEDDGSSDRDDWYRAISIRR